MADNITEADERMIQLLAALNSTLGSYTASQEADTSDSLANQLSSTALVISLIALVISSLQVVLDYASSNSAQGDKCDSGAIGEYARFSRTSRWSWRQWRRQYFYPALDLGLRDVCSDLHNLEFSEVGKVFEGLDNLVPLRLENYEKMELMDHEKPEFYSWRYHSDLESSGPYFIRNGRYCLFRRVGAAWVPALSRDLPMKYRLKWFYHCLSHRRAIETMPRASWAQLLTLLNVDPTEKKDEPSRLLDANCIPSSLDVPAQKVELTDLGCFAFCMGFSHVKIDTVAGEIVATGEIGMITTDSIPGFGAAVRLQVFSPRHQHPLIKLSYYNVLCHRGQLLGSFIFQGTLGYQTIQYGSLRRKFVDSEAVVDGRYPNIADEVKWWLEITANGCKHKSSEASDKEVCLECLEQWQTLVGGRSWPTILLAASAASIPRLTTGFPSFLLRPFLPVFQRLAHSLPVSDSRGESWPQYHLGSLQEGTLMLELLQHDLCRVVGNEYFSWGHDSEDGHLSWMQNACSIEELELIEKVLLSRMCTRNARTQVDGRKFRGVPRGRFVFFQRNQTSSMEISNTLDPVNDESLSEGQLMPYIVPLLEDFDPLAWTEAWRSHSQSSPKYDRWQMNATGEKRGWRNHVKPHNILWTQTFLLDLAITKSRYQLGISIEDVSEALLESWEEPISKASVPLQNLHQFLYQKAITSQTSEETPETPKDFRKLADMIKARTLCYIAYMMVIPDSGSLYKASLEDPVVLPMI